jgi:predicted enzyme related to lactoylglutathione lyase
MPATSRGKFVWHELLTNDLPAAQEFYRNVVGWNVQVWDGGGQPYPMWVAGESPIGGAMELPEEAKNMGAPPHWLAYVSTPDVDATVEQVKSLGGQVLHGPFDIPTIGRMAIIADPQGAVLAAYTAAGDDMARSGQPPVGDFSWHELASTDYAGGLDFYSKLFGWEKQDAMDMGGGNTYQMFGQAPEMYGGMFNTSPEMPSPVGWLHYIHVQSADEAAKKAVELGGTLLNGPMDVPGGDRVAQLMDPQGAAFAVHSKGAASA